MLENKIKSKEAVIGVIGLGYVGLPLIIAYLEKGFKVIGFDIDETKVDMIASGKSYIDHIDSKSLAVGVESNLLDTTIDFSRIVDVDAIIIAVPTPLNKHYEPDLSYVIKTIETVAPYLRKDQIVSLESTTYPGTCDEELKPRIESFGHIVGEDIYLIYSPEREDPGNTDYTSKNSMRLQYPPWF